MKEQSEKKARDWNNKFKTLIIVSLIRTKELLMHGTRPYAFVQWTYRLLLPSKLKVSLSLRAHLVHIWRTFIYRCYYTAYWNINQA